MKIKGSQRSKEMVPRVKASGELSVPPRFSNGRRKASYRSPSPSSEADDEQSLYDPPAMASSERGGGHASGYPGEDTRTTSKKELAGWYSYGWAAEVFVVCGIGSYIPITLEQLARERGLLLSDKKTPCQATFHVHHASHGPTANSSSFGILPEDSEQCIIYFLGYEMNTASFALYTFSFSVLVQALLIVSLTGLADHGRYRKSFLLGCAWVGSIATMLFLPIVPKVYMLGALLALISNVCIGMSFVLLNSFLPLLIRYHPLTRDTAKREDGEDAGSFSGSASASDLDENILIDSTAALLAVPSKPTKDNGSTATQKLDASPQLRLSTEISSSGMGIGYIAGVLVQTLCILIVVLTGSSLFSLRLALFFIGAWWLVFSIPAALWLRPRPGPPLSGRSGRSWLGYIAYAWRYLGKTIMRASRIRDLVLFLSAWFLLSDAIATISGTAILFAKTQLNMKPAGLASINIVTTTCAIIGAFSWSKLSHVMGLKPSQTILVCIFLFELIPLYGLLGFIPAVRRLGVLGLQQPWEMYPLGAIYGFVLGGLSSYCRSLFGELIPAGSEAAFYALYAITDKGSSVFGPAIVGAITDYAGQIRPAFIFLAVLIAIPGPLMWAVDVDRGRRDAAQLYRELVSKAANQPDDEGEPSIH